MNNKYLTKDEQLIYSEKFHSIITSLEQELTKVQEQYVETLKLESAKKKPNVKKLNKLEKQELKLKVKIQRNKIDLLHVENETYVKLNAFEKLVKRFKTMSFESQEKVGGYVMVLPWLIGFALFFAVPLLMTIFWVLMMLKQLQVV